jgi:preprotein translocase subunit SecF
MEFVRPGTYIDFMRHRKVVVASSLLLVIASLVSVFFPGPNYGIDFRGGTELQLVFQGDIDSAEIRATLESLGYRRPDVVAVEGNDREYIVRVREVSSLPAERADAVRSEMPNALGVGVQDIDFKPGDVDDETGRVTAFKISIDLDAEVDPELIEDALETLDVQVRGVSQAGRESDYRYVANLEGIGDEIVRQLREELGARGPDAPRRVEWVGPKAGAQLRDAAVKALLYAIAFIMVYVAFRFDLRFAPGGVLAMAHDVIITMGIYVLVQKEVNLTTVAALLTILGYSINDTIVVFDRIRENMGRMRDKTLFELINISTSQMLSRTIVTSGTTLLSIAAFFVWGTDVIRDIAFALFIGILIGTYSSVYIAAPVTEWMDRRFFRRR